MNEENTVSELSEEMELVGPGSMLAEARKEKGLSQSEVAKRLNFRVNLVVDLEAENFDKSLPETFNRGYLRSYAKLVGLSESEVLTSYEVLHVAEKQGAEMLSFSRSTSIEAENNRITWVSYLILAALIASTVVWWVQDESNSEAVKLTSASIKSNALDNNEAISAINEEIVSEAGMRIDENAQTEDNASLDMPLSENTSSASLSVSTELSEVEPQVLPVANITSDASAAVSDLTEVVAEIEVAELEAPKELITTPAVDVQFTFVGDCWVDIYDANGEHIAWGIKKEGYVMNISATPPIAVTLGKPELVAITFEDSEVDMSQYRKGRIAKLTLPLAL